MPKTLTKHLRARAWALLAIVSAPVACGSNSDVSSSPKGAAGASSGGTSGVAGAAVLLGIVDGSSGQGDGGAGASTTGGTSGANGSAGSAGLNGVSGSAGSSVAGASGASSTGGETGASGAGGAPVENVLPCPQDCGHEVLCYDITDEHPLPCLTVLKVYDMATATCSGPLFYQVEAPVIQTSVDGIHQCCYDWDCGGISGRPLLIAHHARVATLVRGAAPSWV